MSPACILGHLEVYKCVKPHMKMPHFNSQHCGKQGFDTGDEIKSTYLHLGAELDLCQQNTHNQINYIFLLKIYFKTEKKH